MDQQRVSSIVSLVSAIAIVVASFFSWADPTWAGGLRMKRWPRVLFGAVLVALVVALVLLLTA